MTDQRDSGIEQPAGIVRETVVGGERPPEPPPSGPLVWMRENLFSGSTAIQIGFNALLTVVFVLISLAGLRFLTGYFFSPDRRWGAVTSNMKFLMVQAFPQSDLGRVWLSLGIFFVLVAMSLAAWGVGGRITVEKTFKGLRAAAIFVLLLVIIHPANPPSTNRLIIGALALLVAAVAHLVLRRYGPAASEIDFPFLSILAVGMIAVVIVIRFIELPFPTSAFEEAPAPIATTTTNPWAILVLVAIASYFVGQRLTSALGDRLRRLLVIGWIASYPIIIMIIQRNPLLDWADILGFGDTPFLQSDLGTFIIFGAIGVAILWWMASPDTGESGRMVASALIVVALLSWLFPMAFVYRILLLGFALVALAAPSFGGTDAGRRRLVMGWLVLALLTTAGFRLGEAETSLSFQGTTFLGGFNLTILLAITGVALSFPLGVVLALARTSTMPIFRLIATSYIELVRSVPLITWLFFGSVMLSLFLPSGVEFDEIVRIVAAVTIFSAAYVAENVRGGLQSVNRGQYEASRAMGLTTVQAMSLIILPQAIRAVIPALVGSIIVSFKDTSLVAIIGLADVLWIARTAIPASTTPFNFLGTQPQMLFFIAIFYWIFTFTFSRLSLRYEKRLGLGER